MSKKSLPKGFRYLFSKKEIKEIEEITQLNFESVDFGNITNVNQFKSEDYYQSWIHPISLSVRLTSDGWKFRVFQSGFRNELIPNSFEHEIKTKVKNELRMYFDRILNSIETDFLNRPQLWVYTSIVDNKVRISSKSIK